MLRNVASRHVASYHVMSRHVMSCHVMSHHVTSCHVMSRHATWCTSCHVMARHVTSCHIPLCHVMSRHVMSRHVTSCPVMSRHVISCYVKSRRKSRDGHATNASLSTEFFHTQSIQIKHDHVRWLSRRLPIQYRLSGIWSSCHILPFQAEIQKNLWMVSTNPIFCTQGLPNWWKKRTPNTSVTDGQTNNVLYYSCDDVIKPNRIELRSCVPLCGRFFFEKIFRIGSPVPEILFENCYPRPPSSFLNDFQCLNKLLILVSNAHI